MPPNDCQFNIQHWPDKMCILNGINPKFNRGQLLVMTNHHTKLEEPLAISSLVIDRTRFVYGPTYQPACAQQYTPTSSKGLSVHTPTHPL